MGGVHGALPSSEANPEPSAGTSSVPEVSRLPAHARGLPMTNLDSYEELSREYQELLEAYGDALKTGDPRVATLFAQATAAFKALQDLHGSLESALNEDAHLARALSYAVVAGNAAEARRLYEAMSEVERRNVDKAEEIGAHQLRIWLKGR